LTRILITGADGFVGKNLQLHLSQRKETEVLLFTRRNSLEQLSQMICGVDVIFHLAGVNRPQVQEEFGQVNFELTRQLCEFVVREMRETGKPIKVVYTSSIQAELDNPYGRSKREAEEALLVIAKNSDLDLYIYRLPNVFGKWSKPNYNSVVATFCYNLARDLPIQINNPEVMLNLVYVDDLLNEFEKVLDGLVKPALADSFAVMPQTYQITVGDLAEKLRGFRSGMESLHVDKVGEGLTKALYATYVSFLPKEKFVTQLKQHEDSRGVFVEMLKTRDSGQFSYFTAHPGVTRGGHFHHSKTEKFLVIIGEARFRFRHMQTGETYEVNTSGELAQVVETIPGWTHDITNTGTQDLVVMLWANEIFDPKRPDTYSCPV